MSRPLLLAHLAGIAVHLGATVLLAIATPLLAAGDRPAAERRRSLLPLFRAYSPLAVGALGVALMTGAWGLTPYKQALGAEYFARIGYALAGKLSLAFLVILFGVYLTMGLCLRTVREDEAEIPIEDAVLDGRVRRLVVGAWLVVGLTLWTIWVAIGMGTPALPAS
ncbi:MAG TPA: hypothetical protein VEC57_00705 [Candidatus Limnocylindrales bacterium]|nr:hypothetical protein [Candidatus Limnocylindrales bacterium]